MLQTLRKHFFLLRDGWRQTDALTQKRHLIFFSLTFLTVFLSGLNFSSRSRPLEKYLDAAVYAVALMTILMGYAGTRYVQARSYGIFASLPLFIPFPLFTPFGTLGVLTRTTNVGVHTRALFDVAFWPPVISFLLSLPCLLAGAYVTDVVQGKPMFENPLLLKFFAQTFKDIPLGYDLGSNPLLAAGWAGLFFTAVNLLPIGSLSGGQLAYTLFGHRQRDIAYVAMAGLFTLALYYPMWFGFVLAFVYMGIEHPELRQARNPHFFDMGQTTLRQPLDRRRQYFAIVSAVIFALSFTFKPFDPTLEHLEDRAPAQTAPQELAPAPSQPTPPPSDENSI